MSGERRKEKMKHVQLKTMHKPGLRSEERRKDSDNMKTLNRYINSVVKKGKSEYNKAYDKKETRGW